MMAFRDRRSVISALGVLGALALGIVCYKSLQPPSLSPNEWGWRSALSHSLHDIDQHRVTLKQWQGKTLIINFWATWCEPCRKEIPDLVKFRAQHQQKGESIEVIGVAMDWKPEVQAFMKSVTMTYPVIIAPDDAPDMMRQWGNRQGVLPFTVILNAEQNRFDVMTGSVDLHELSRRLSQLQ
jgi:thiol-disulfide isomerase/thioredoxin